MGLGILLGIVVLIAKLKFDPKIDRMSTGKYILWYTDNHGERKAYHP